MFTLRDAYKVCLIAITLTGCVVLAKVCSSCSSSNSDCSSSKERTHRIISSSAYWDVIQYNDSTLLCVPHTEKKNPFLINTKNADLIQTTLNNLR